MRMCERKILYNLQQKLTQNLVKVYENAFVAKFSGIWQHSTYKTALTTKNAFFFSKKGGRERVKGQINQDFDIFSFNPIYLLCVDLVSNKHILKFQVNWTYDRRDNGT